MTNQPERIAIVTGATSGIGEATTRAFVAAGYGVVGTGRTGHKLAALEQELGADFCGLPGDAADAQVLDGLFTAAAERFGRPADIVVANAGRGLGGSVTTADLSEFEAMMRTNVTGTLLLLRRAAASMLKHQAPDFPKPPADIVVVGSVVGRHISPFSAVYGASKFAVHALAEALRREVGPKGVRVSLVEPGIVLSGFQAGAGYAEGMVDQFVEKFGPLPSCADIAEAIRFIVAQPPHVHVSDLVVRPTRQDYP